MFTVASRFRRLNFVESYFSTIEAVGTGSWLSVVQVLLDVSIALLVAIIEFHGGIQRGYRTISSELFFVKRYMQDFLILILLRRNRQVPGLATGAVGHSLFYSRR